MISILANEPGFGGDRVCVCVCEYGNEPPSGSIHTYIRREMVHCLSGIPICTFMHSTNTINCFVFHLFIYFRDAHARNERFICTNNQMVWLLLSAPCTHACWPRLTILKRTHQFGQSWRASISADREKSSRLRPAQWFNGVRLDRFAQPIHTRIGVPRIMCAAHLSLSPYATHTRTNEFDVFVRASQSIRLRNALWPLHVDANSV